VETTPSRKAPLSSPGLGSNFTDCAPAMLWAARPDMSCEYLSRAWLEFTGYSREQGLGEGWSRGVHPEDLARWLDTMVRAFDARESYETEYRLRRRDGEFRWVLEHAGPRYSADGVFLGYIGSCIDIDQRKRSESELARSLERERRLRTSIEEASRLKEAFVLSVLEDLESPVRAIQSCAAHLRAQLPAGSEAAPALDSIERNAGAQGRILDSLIELSRATRGGGRRQPPRERAQAQEPLLGGARVLLVGGDARSREALVKVLRAVGAETRAAANSDEAIGTLGAPGVWRPDVLLCDCDACDGHTLIRALRTLPAERGGCLRAVALTEASPGQELQAVAAGYDAQLAKPVEPVMLLATVARLFQPTV
jgi:PAS domain S-box-containing protein